MRYSIARVRENGARFELENGKISDLYACVLGSLEEHFKRQDINFDLPMTPNFNSFPDRASRLDSLELRMAHEDEEPTEHSKINMTYFRARKKPKVIDRDYCASENFSVEPGEVTYEALTIFFNTDSPGVAKKDRDWANEAQRDLFLHNLKNFVDYGCHDFVIKTNKAISFPTKGFYGR